MSEGKREALTEEEIIDHKLIEVTDVIADALVSIEVTAINRCQNKSDQLQIMNLVDYYGELFDEILARRQKGTKNLIFRQMIYFLDRLDEFDPGSNEKIKDIFRKNIDEIKLI